MVDQNIAFDQLTIEEYVHNSTVLTAGLSKNGPDQGAYISMIRDTGKIPLIMRSIEKDGGAASTALHLNASLVQNILAIYAPAYSGTDLQNYALLQQPYGTFDLIEKVVANLAQYEHLDQAVYLQLLTAEKYVIDTNEMPRIQFWIDDMVVFADESKEDLQSVQAEKMASLIRACFSQDFIPKQLMGLADDVQNGKYATSLDILGGLKIARQAYFDSDSERKGEIIIRRLWAKMQKRMLLIVLLLIALVYGFYWFYYSRTETSDTVYKSYIGDIQFVLQPDTSTTKAEPSTYVLMFPEQAPETSPSESQTENELTQSESTNTPSGASQNIIIRPGDNLFRISLQYYGDGNYYNQLAQYNNISNPNLIPVGLSLEIPPLEVLLQAVQ